MNRRQAIQHTGLLTGASFMIPSFLALLQSCGEETRLDWKPLFFTVDEAVFMAKLVDTILPRTDTPGALDVKADMFMDRVFAKTYNEAAQAQIRADMAQFNADCQKEYGAVFADLSEADRAAVLTAAEAQSPTFNGTVWGTSVGKQEPVGFYRSIKSMAIWAYLSSEEIGENVLSYDPVPAVYQGCIPLADVGNSWSL